MIRINQLTVRDAIDKNVRLDGRDFLNYRNIQIRQDSKGTLIHLGNTIIYVNSNLTLERIDRQKVLLTCDISDRWLLKVVEQCIDLEALMINKHVGWKLEIKLQTIQNDGNMLDAFVIGVLSQLLTIKKLHVNEDLRIIPANERNPISLQLLYYPISITICFIGDHIIVDPVAEEMALSDGIYSVIVNEHEEVCAFVPIKTKKLDFEQLQSMLVLAIEKSRDIRNHVRSGKYSK